VGRESRPAAPLSRSFPRRRPVEDDVDGPRVGVVVDIPEESLAVCRRRVAAAHRIVAKTNRKQAPRLGDGILGTGVDADSEQGALRIHEIDLTAVAPPARLRASRGRYLPFANRARKPL